ncbi:M28 family peptidase [Chitinophaga sp. MM2321]|uniref:M28 family peptidase n=1 Tax=Chitinophaga sp. MM2321 TaxID=3137178 RepID=UPI0032D59E8D
MMRVPITIACTLLLFTVHAQVTPQKSAQVSDQGVAARYGEGITPAVAKKQLHIIAGADMEGRETATRGQERAAAYIISQFRAAGLQPGNKGDWEQHYPMYTDSLLHSSITAGDSTYNFGEDYYADVKISVHTDVTSTAIIFVNYGMISEMQNDYAGLDVKDKVVMMKEGIAPGFSAEKGNLNTRIKVAKEQGAQAVFVVSGFSGLKATDQQQIRNTGLYTRKDTASHLNVYYLTRAAAAAITGGSSNSNKPAVISKPVHIIFEKKETTLLPSNVLGYLEGTDKKDEVVFITAHYDHLGMSDGQIYYGADDDGSGCTAVIEIANAFARARAAGHGPRRSIVFMTVSGEEKGLLGSAYYTDHPVYPLSNTVVDLNIDMIGRIDPAHQHDSNYVYIIGDNKLSSALRPINERANNAYTKLQLDYKYNDPNDPEQFYYRSDHYMFARHGIPVIFYFNGTHADYHQPTDTVEKIDYHLLARRARLVFYTAWDIANREDKLVVDTHEK